MSKKALRIKSQLKSPTFKKWMAKAPKNRPGHENWRIYVQKKKGGRWYRLKRDFATYKEAYRWFAKHLNDYYDIALTSKVYQYWPPKNEKGRTVLPAAAREPHTQWCSFCRRVTRFLYFRKHHAVPEYYLDPAERYCEICGARLKLAVIGASRPSLTPHRMLR